LAFSFFFFFGSILPTAYTIKDAPLQLPPYQIQSFQHVWSHTPMEPPLSNLKLRTCGGVRSFKDDTCWRVRSFEDDVLQN